MGAASGYIWGHNFWTDQYLDSLRTQIDRLNLSFVKDEHTVGKKMARNGPKTAIYQLLFFAS